ncbi:enoyl-CoA hydratase/isomerase family protein [Sinimarinibacterium flocculans]|uniref:enoyl-CoA hydratase/isomerase family protein n=1 Tax=Sinimarinibacterium flocculans TaxID=985250 RepID=UPI00248FE14C|nr:enoyl-CoA hydratase/isomerase family protein [Sinimarinibacterium flocculans]
MSDEVLGADALRALCAAGDESHHALSDTPYLLCDPAGLDDDDALTAWLRTRPCPVIGIGDGSAAVTDACDTIAASERELAAMTAAIRRTPLAATVLVQLLRASEGLPLEAALIAESLAYATLQGGREFRAWLAGHRPAPPPAPDDGPAVLLERDDERLRLTLNRPSNRNAMTVEMRDALCEALQLALLDPGIAQVRIDARGKCFSTGGDLGEFGSAPDTATAHAVRSLALPGRLLARCGERAVVALHGACVGSGIEFPAFAARTEAREDAWFQLPELRYGLIPGAGGCVSVTRRIGRQRTAWMVLSGQRIAARTALEWGLIDAIIPAP